MDSDTQNIKLCFITGNECNCDIKPLYNVFFVGFKFKSKYYEKEDMKNAIKQAFNGYPFKPWFPDDNSEPEHITVPICRMIMSSFFSIFEISDQAPNVLIELGMAMGNGKIVTILRNRESESVPTDIDGIYRIHYSDLSELVRRTRNIIPKIIKKLSKNYPDFDNYIKEHQQEQIIKVLKEMVNVSSPVHDTISDSLGIPSEYLILFSEYTINIDQSKGDHTSNVKEEN